MKTLKVVNGDIVRAYSGSGYTYVSGKTKARQDVGIILTSDIRDTTGLGAGLDELIGEDNPSTTYSDTPLLFSFQQRIRSALLRLREAQRKYNFNRRTPDELIQEIAPVQMWQWRTDPRTFRWVVDILTVEGRENITINGRTRM